MEKLWEPVIEKYYSDNLPLKNLLLLHSRLVADRSLKIAVLHPELDLDTVFLEQAAMLHDVGIFQTNAEPIFCYGNYPYICHGILGAQLLRAEGLPRHALVAERHTGTGLTLEQIVSQNLPVPHRDMVPVSLEEQVICFADKFYSKTNPTAEKTVEGALKSLEKFGRPGMEKFKEWCSLFL